MTQTIKQIGTVVLDSPLHINEFNTTNDIMGEVVMSANGTHISYSAQIYTPYRTAESRGEGGWLSEQNKTDLEALWVNLGTTFDIVYEDDSTETVRMAHEKQIDFTEIAVGACIYTAFIPMAKV